MIQRRLAIICDRCGAEGPTVTGEKRVELIRDACEEGWMLDDRRHSCAECAKLSVFYTQPPITLEAGVSEKIKVDFEKNFPEVKLLSAKIAGAPSAKRFDKKEPQP